MQAEGPIGNSAAGLYAAKPLREEACMGSEAVERQLAEPPAGLVRYRLAFRAKTAANARHDGVGVALDNAFIQWGEDGRKSFHEIPSICLWPYTISDGAEGGRCDIRFSDGTFLMITSDKPYAVNRTERDKAYAQFVHELHARLDGESRARITFQDGMSPAKMIVGAIIIFALFCGPTAVLLLNAWLSPGLPWLLALGTLVLAACGLAVRAAQRRGPKLYAPDRPPRTALP
jgi:hypothetical protein